MAFWHLRSAIRSGHCECSGGISDHSRERDSTLDIFRRHSDSALSRQATRRGGSHLPSLFAGEPCCCGWPWLAACGRAFYLFVDFRRVWSLALLRVVRNGVPAVAGFRWLHVGARAHSVLHVAAWLLVARCLFRVCVRRAAHSLRASCSSNGS